MTYDKKTGDVTIHDPKDKVKEKIVKNYDEVYEQKQKLFQELDLDESGLPKDENVDP